MARRLSRKFKQREEDEKIAEAVRYGVEQTQKKRQKELDKGKFCYESCLATHRNDVSQCQGDDWDWNDDCARPMAQYLLDSDLKKGQKPKQSLADAYGGKYTL